MTLMPGYLVFLSFVVFPVTATTSKVNPIFRRRRIDKTISPVATSRNVKYASRHQRPPLDKTFH